MNTDQKIIKNKVGLICKPVPKYLTCGSPLLDSGKFLGATIRVAPPMQVYL